MGMTEDESQEFHFKIKGNTYELSVTGSLEFLRTNLEQIKEFIDEVNEILGEGERVDIETPTEEEILEAPTSEVPVIRVQRSTISNIQSLFDTDWGRTPRSSAEVARALEINAVPDSAGAIGVYLRRLVQRGVLRRIEREGRYHYIRIPDEG